MCPRRRAARLETRPPVQGGEGGGRVSFAACRALGQAVTGGEGPAGGELASPFQSAGGRGEPFSVPRRRAMRPHAILHRISAWMERRPRAASLDRQVGLRRREFKCENTKLDCVKRNILGACHANGRRNAPAAACEFRGLRALSWRRLHARCAAASQPPSRPRRARRRVHRRRTCCRPRCGSASSARRPGSRRPS